MTDYKLNKSWNKSQVKAFLGAIAPDVQKLSRTSEEGKNLWDSFNYTNKTMKEQGDKSVTKNDLMELAKDAVELLSKAVATPVAADTTSKVEKIADSGKKPAKVQKESSLKKTSKKEEPKKEETAATPKDAPKKTLKKGEKKSEPEEKKQTVQKGSKTEKQSKGESKGAEKKPVEKKEAPKKDVAKYDFPKEYTDSDGNKFSRCDDLKTYEDILDCDDEVLYFISHWDKTMLEGYCPKQKESRKFLSKDGFPDDLDIAETIKVGERVKNVTTASLYTEAVMFFTAADIKARKSAGLYFEIYRVEEEAE